MEQIDLFATEEESKEIQELKEKVYSSKIQIPQYIPSEVCPSLNDCVDILKYRELLDNINKSNISEEEKQFLKLAATRHIKFTYSKIADYYAHATPEMQKLMEDSALVILDIKDAIADGYVQLSTRLDDIIGDALDE